MKIKIGSLVAFNNLQDATWFEVIAIEGVILTIREEKTNYAVQYMDRSLVKQVR